MARFFAGVGRALRETGQALDRLGLRLQGDYGFQETLSRHRPVLGIRGQVPSLPKTGFIAPSASVIGDVKIGEGSSIWYGTVLRGDVNGIKVGAFTNIQDNCVVHVAKHNVANKAQPTIIGDKVTIGHGATIHACTIEDEAIVGMGSVVMDGAVVKKGAMVAAGAIVTPGTVVPSGQIFAGNPARLLRAMTPAEASFGVKSAENYASLAQDHAEENGKSWPQIAADIEARAELLDRDPDYDPAGFTARFGKHQALN